jgi:hypothetical protein
VPNVNQFTMGVPVPAAVMAASIPAPTIVTPGMIGSSFPAQSPASGARATEVYSRMTGHNVR